MPEINVNEHAIGRVLQKDILTSFGLILFEKGHQISECDLEYFEAFKINTVLVEETAERKNIKKVENAVEKPNQKAEKTLFQIQYDKAVSYMEKMMQNVAGGSVIPVMEIREWLKPLIEQVTPPTGWLMAIQPVEHSSRYTYHHSIGVALISSIIARSNRFPENEIMQVALAGLLCDIGKCKIDPRILIKAGPLTAQEFEEIKNHTLLGYQIIKGTMGLSEGVALAALQHHEREDGSGYPLGIRGDKIHPYAKIVAIADVFHAMCSLRSYKEKESPFRVLEHIRYEYFGRLEPGMVHEFIGKITQLPLGTRVRLNDGRLGKMIYVDRTHPTRPTIDLDGEIISLSQRTDLYIQEILL